MSPHAGSELKECIDQCLACYASCEATMMHCLGLGGHHASTTHIRALTDCSKLCLTSADFMLRGSEQHMALCALCAEACGRCADECEAMEGADAVMLKCAEQCRRCAEACERMVATRV
jgi:hypothetical protein